MVQFIVILVLDVGQLDNFAIEGAVEAISKADLIIVAGTSLSVYPASGLIRFFKGNHIVVINKEHLSSIGQLVDLEINLPVGEVFKQLM